MPTIPVTFYITPFAERGNIEPATWTCPEAQKALEVANHIWMAANVQFSASDSCVSDSPLDMQKNARTGDQVILDTLSSRHPAQARVNVFLINRVEGLNAGVCSYLASDPEPASFVQTFSDAKMTGRMMAHEFGHLLGLDHADIDYQNERAAAKLLHNLMVPGLSVGIDLSPSQVKQAKTSKLLKKFAG